MGAISKVGQTAKFLFNRMLGVKYGGVKFADGTLQLVKTDRLCRLNTTLYKNYGEWNENISKANVGEILRLTKPLQKGSKISVPEGTFEYLNVHGASQVYSNLQDKPLITVCEKLKNPIRTYLKG